MTSRLLMRLDKEDTQVSIQVFLTMLLACSILTSLTVEGIKKMVDDFKVKYSANIVTAIVAVVLAVAMSVGYYLYKGLAFDTVFALMLVSLVFLSWLCAMVGYDKVMQGIGQLVKAKALKEDEGHD